MNKFTMAGLSLSAALACAPTALAGDFSGLYGSIGYMNVRYETVGVIGSTRSSDLRLGAGVEHQFSDLLSFRIGADYAKPAGEATYRIKAGLLVSF